MNKGHVALALDWWWFHHAGNMLLVVSIHHPKPVLCRSEYTWIIRISTQQAWIGTLTLYEALCWCRSYSRVQIGELVPWRYTKTSHLVFEHRGVFFICLFWFFVCLFVFCSIWWKCYFSELSYFSAQCSFPKKKN